VTNESHGHCVRVGSSTDITKHSTFHFSTTVLQDCPCSLSWPAFPCIKNEMWLV